MLVGRRSGHWSVRRMPVGERSGHWSWSDGEVKAFGVRVDPVGVTVGAVSCNVCPAGKFNDQSDAACDDCAAGRFSTGVASNSSNCLICSAGHFTAMSNDTGLPSVSLADDNSAYGCCTQPELALYRVLIFVPLVWFILFGCVQIA